LWKWLWGKDSLSFSDGVCSGWHLFLGSILGISGSFSWGFGSWISGSFSWGSILGGSLGIIINFGLDEVVMVMMVMSLDG